MIDPTVRVHLSLYADGALIYNSDIAMYKADWSAMQVHPGNAVTSGADGHTIVVHTHVNDAGNVNIGIYQQY